MGKKIYSKKLDKEIADLIKSIRLRGERLIDSKGFVSSGYANIMNGMAESVETLLKARKKYLE